MSHASSEDVGNSGVAPSKLDREERFRLEGLHDNNSESVAREIENVAGICSKTGAGEEANQAHVLARRSQRIATVGMSADFRARRCRADIAGLTHKRVSRRRFKVGSCKSSAW